MELLHQFIPVDFRYDGCSSNGDADAVTVDDWLLNSSIKIFYEESIDKDVIRWSVQTINRVNICLLG